MKYHRKHHFFDCCDNVENQNFDAQNSKSRKKILENIWLNNCECEKVKNENEKKNNDKINLIWFEIEIEMKIMTE